MARVLVTGGSGLIGWAVVERLLADGHDVTVLDLMPNWDNLRAFAGQIDAGVGDVADLSGLIGIVKRARISHIVHLAAMVTQPALLDPAGAFRVNALGTAAIFDAALATGVERVVWTSSLSALEVGPDYDGQPVPEDFPHKSTQPYGASKHAAEVIADGYRRNFDLDLVGFRPAQTYGLGRLGSGAGIFNEAIRNIALGKPAVIPRSRTRHQSMYNRDMAFLLTSTLFGPRPDHHLFNVPVAFYSNEEMHEILLEVCPGADISFIDIPGHTPRVPLMNAALARQELAFEARYSLEDGVREMVEHFRAEETAH